MNRTSLTVLLAVSMAASVGCASKNYVRQETTPLINKTNELDDLTAKNSKDIKDVDTRAQAGIQQVQTSAAAADQKAQAAGQQADQAQTSANNAVHRVDSLQNAVANLDNYKVVTETAVHFGFNKDNLTKDAKASLDQLANDVSNTKGYILTVEGATDSVGDSEYNYGLSQRRADAVIQYLASETQYSRIQDLCDRLGQGQARGFQQDRSRTCQEPPCGCALDDEHRRRHKPNVGDEPAVRAVAVNKFHPPPRRTSPTQAVPSPGTACFYEHTIKDCLEQGGILVFATGVP